MTSENRGEFTEDESGIREYLETREFDLADEKYSIYECIDEECDNVVLSVPGGDVEMTCHGEAMKEIKKFEMDVKQPDLRHVLLDAFGLPKPGLDICLCVIGEGPISPSEVAEKLDYSRSTISRYLNELVEIGLLQKSQLNREDGGYVNVYHSIDIEKMRRETLIGFYVWAGEAAALIEEANITKEEYLKEDSSENLHEIFWEELQKDS